MIHYNYYLILAAHARVGVILLLVCVLCVCVCVHVHVHVSVCPSSGCPPFFSKTAEALSFKRGYVMG